MLGSKYFVRNQEPITLAESEPEPDLAVVSGDVEQYRDRHPGPEEIQLVIEVSDATLSRDRGIKNRLYAEANIPVYWVVNLIDLQVEVYSRPVHNQVSEYGEKRLVTIADQSIPVVIDGAQVGGIPIDLLFKS